MASSTRKFDCGACFDTGRYIRELPFGNFMTLCFCNAGIEMTKLNSASIVDLLAIMVEYGTSGTDTDRHTTMAQVHEHKAHERRISEQWYQLIVTNEIEYRSNKSNPWIDPKRKLISDMRDIVGVGQTDAELAKSFMYKLTEWNAAHSPTEGSTIRSYDVHGDGCGCSGCRSITGPPSSEVSMTSGYAMTGDRDTLHEYYDTVLQFGRLRAINIVRNALRSYDDELNRLEAMCDHGITEAIEAREVKLANDALPNGDPMKIVAYQHNRW